MTVPFMARDPDVTLHSLALKSHKNRTPRTELSYPPFGQKMHKMHQKGVFKRAKCSVKMHQPQHA